MRPVLFVALLGTSLSTQPVKAQTPSDQPASGTATPRMAKSHPKPNNGWLFENGPVPKDPAAKREALARLSQLECIEASKFFRFSRGYC
jgi:hypothetical protein